MKLWGRGKRVKRSQSRPGACPQFFPLGLDKGVRQQQPMLKSRRLATDGHMELESGLRGGPLSREGLKHPLPLLARNERGHTLAQRMEQRQQVLLQEAPTLATSFAQDNAVDILLHFDHPSLLQVHRQMLGNIGIKAPALKGAVQESAN